ncbi:hypothetical protein [Pantoea sp.]|uniref:hypothetical protein n=1 Tax=Pantoea sp. TaxID=69393 RepID=UPI0031D98F9F
MNASKIKLYLFIIITCNFYMIMYQFLSLRVSNDDVFFSNALESRGLLDFLLYRYETWSGRVTIEGLLSFTIGNQVFWKLMIPTSFIVLVCSISRLTTKRVRFNTLMIAAVILLLTPNKINEDAFFWVTGAYNYILPFSLAIYSLSVFTCKNRGKLNSLLSISALFIASFSEQSALFLLLLSYLMMAFKKVEVSFYSIAYISVLTVCSLIMFAAPGNALRFSAETVTWMPQFKDYSLLTKIMFGVDRLGNAYSMPFNIPLFCLSAVLIYLNKDKKLGLLPLISSLIIIIYMVLSLYVSLSGHGVSTYFFNWLSPDLLYPWPEKFSSLSGLGSMLFTIIFSLCIMFNSALLIKGLDRTSIPLIAISCGMASVIMIGFSPTVYASYFRVLYLLHICAVIAICSLVHNHFMYGQRDATSPNIKES